jgi:hypothetical protein
MSVCLLSMLIYTNENLGRVRVYLTSRPIFSVMIALKFIKVYIFFSLCYKNSAAVLQLVIN